MFLIFSKTRQKALGIQQIRQPKMHLKVRRYTIHEKECERPTNTNSLYREWKRKRAQRGYK
jgi:hypothetical protein